MAINLLGTPMGMMPGYGEQPMGFPALGGGQGGGMQPAGLPGGGVQQHSRPDFFNILGQVSDAISESRGAPASYAMAEQRRTAQQQAEEMQRKQQEAQNALAQWLQNPEDQAAFTRALLADPDRALGIRKGIEGEAYTLGEGQVRYQGGKEVARGPEGAPETVTIDGVVFDKATGQPLFESPYERVIPGPDGSFYTQPRHGYGRQPQGQPAQPAQQAAPILRKASESGMMTAEEEQAVRSGLGENGGASFDGWLAKNGVVVTKNVGGQTYYRVGGKWYDNPEGR